MGGRILFVDSPLKALHMFTGKTYGDLVHNFYQEKCSTHFKVFLLGAGEEGGKAYCLLAVY